MQIAHGMRDGLSQVRNRATLQLQSPGGSSSLQGIFVLGWLGLEGVCKGVWFSQVLGRLCECFLLFAVLLMCVLMCFDVFDVRVRGFSAF